MYSSDMVQSLPFAVLLLTNERGRVKLIDRIEVRLWLRRDYKCCTTTDK